MSAEHTAVVFPLIERLKNDCSAWPIIAEAVAVLAETAAEGRWAMSTHEAVDRATLAPWRKVILYAADLIAERGLAKRTQEDDYGRLCVSGAISLAVSGVLYANYRGLAKRASRELCKMVSPGDSGPAYWNNVPERTAEEVISAMRDCALRGVKV